MGEFLCFEGSQCFFFNVKVSKKNSCVRKYVNRVWEDNSPTMCSHTSLLEPVTKGQNSGLNDASVSRVDCFCAKMEWDSLLIIAIVYASENCFCCIGKKTTVLIEVILCLYSWCYASSWNQICILHCKCILMFVAVWSVYCTDCYTDHIPWATVVHCSESTHQSPWACFTRQVLLWCCWWHTKL